MNTPSEYKRSIKALHERLLALAGEVRRIESQADRVLKEKYDLQEYRSLLQKKAEILSSAPEELQLLILNLPQPLKEKVAYQLHLFAGNAEQSLKVNSVFFMRQLLYPENYREGQDNDLEKLIRVLSR